MPQEFVCARDIMLSYASIRKGQIYYFAKKGIILSYKKEGKSIFDLASVKEALSKRGFKCIKPLEANPNIIYNPKTSKKEKKKIVSMDISSPLGDLASAHNPLNQKVGLLFMPISLLEEVLKVVLR